MNLNKNWNKQSFFKINGLVGRYKWLDVFGWVGGKIVIFAMIILYIILAFLFIPSCKFLIVEFAFSGLVVVLGLLLSLFIGSRAKIRRPFTSYPKKVKKLFSPSLFKWKSFPSDHVMIAYLLIFFSIQFGLFWVIIFSIMALWVAWGRIFGGVHYPLDSLGGILIAFSSLLLVNSTLILFIFFLDLYSRFI